MPDQAPPEQAKLAGLAAAAAPLEPDAAERARLMALAADHVARFLTELPDMPAHSPWSPDGAEEGFTAAARPFEPLLRHIADQVDRPGMATASPRYMAYIPGGGLFASAIADFLAAAANKYAGYGPAAPGAVKLENDTVAWLAEVVGYPKTAAGVLTSGGSLATIAALTAARDAADEAGGGAVYLSGLTHHCVDKALHVIGRGRAPRRRIATDASGRMIPAALAAALAADAEAGVRPWLVVATAGATDTGAVDPLAEIAEICRRTGVWLHVDGAYGGLFRLCPEGEAVLAGIEQADSLVLDPHKTLFLPYGTGAALTRDGARLIASFGADANYLRRVEIEGIGPSPADLGPELTRPFRALRLWLPLRLAGVEAFRAAQSEKILLARLLHARLAALPGFEVGPPPDLSVVAFRYRPKRGDADAFNERLIAFVQDEGRAFLSGTRIAGAFWLRAAILSFRTHLEHVEDALASLARGVAALEAAPG